MASLGGNLDNGENKGELLNIFLVCSFPQEWLQGPPKGARGPLPHPASDLTEQSQYLRGILLCLPSKLQMNGKYPCTAFPKEFRTSNFPNFSFALNACSKMSEGREKQGKQVSPQVFATVQGIS